MNKVKDCRYGKMIYNTLDAWVGRSFDLYGEFSEHEIGFLLSQIKPGDVVIDVGANIGAMTIPFAQKLDKTGYVVAFEPQEFVFQTLCGNVAINNLHNVKLFQRAVNDLPNSILHVPNINYEKEGNFGGVEMSEQCGPSMAASYPVSTMTIDQLKLSKVSLIKIDVEGMELAVLKGAQTTIDKHKPLLYLECDREENTIAILQYLESLGYDYKLHSPPLFNQNNITGNLTDVLLVEGKRVISLNLFCFHKNRPIDLNEYEFFSPAAQLLFRTN